MEVATGQTVKERAVLVVESDPVSRRGLESALRSLGYRASVAVSIDEALGALGRHDYLCCLLDARVNGREGLDLLRRLQDEGRSSPPVILIADEHDTQRVSEAAGLVAEDFLPKRFKPADLENVLKEVEARPRTTPPVPLLTAVDDADEPPALVRRQVGLWPSARMREVWEIIQQAARVDVTVLVEGETGTGKDVVASAIHQFSSRRAQPFVKVNWAAMPRELLESELFGHERGAFTDARERRLGKLELAHGGTLFLDEIGDMPADLQTKLLRALQERTIERVGGHEPIRVDVRVLAATNRDLESLMREGKFREDLFYRINVVPIRVPALRERPDDIPFLADHFLKKYRQEHGKPSVKLISAAGFQFKGSGWYITDYARKGQTESKETSSNEKKDGSKDGSADKSSSAKADAKESSPKKGGKKD